MFFRVYSISFCFLLITNTACNISRNTVQVPEKIHPGALRKDLEILHRGLEEYHPSLYAYTPQNELDHAFKKSIESIRDSLSVSEFAYKIIAPFIARIRCGHTSVSLPSHYMRYLRSNPPESFPLFMKFFGDTMMVYRNLHLSDSIFKRGTKILNINGLDSRAIKNRLFSSFPTDGYAESVNLARINNNFPFYHRIVMGVDSTYTIDYFDDKNLVKTSTIRAFKAGSHRKKSVSPKNSPQKRSALRSTDLELRLDTGANLAYMFMANFDHPLKSHRFIRKSFKKIKQHQIEHLIIDLRTNGGGVIDNEVFLARHLRKTRFRVADSAVAIKRTFKGYGKYFRNEWINGLIIKLFTREDEHGRFHMTGYWEKRQFKPIRHRFFHGQVYILTGGMTFSAASLFCITLKGQDNVRLIGEETGGSGYANNGLLIPDFVLPYSRVKVRVPLFRLVPDSTAINNGRGVFPDIPVSSTSASLKAGFDPVMFSTLSLIRKYKAQQSGSSDHK